MQLVKVESSLIEAVDMLLEVALILIGAMHMSVLSYFYAFQRKREEEASDSIITCTILICYQMVTILFNLGSIFFLCIFLFFYET